MKATDMLFCSVWEDSSLTLMARITGNAGTNITQASLSALTCRVFDSDDDNEEILPAPTITIAATVFDTLQTSDPRWTVDTTGYNFKFTIPAANFPTGPRRVQWQFKFTPTSGDPFFWNGWADVLETLGQ